MKRSVLTSLIFLILLSDCSKLQDESNSAKSLLSRLLLRRNSTKTINSALPTSLAIALPRSIRKTSSTSGSNSVRGLLLGDDASSDYTIKASPDPATLISDGRSGNAYLTEQTDLIATILKESKMDMILISGVYDTAVANPGTCIAGGTSKISVTQEMIDEIVSGLEDLGLSNAEALAQLAALQDAGSLPSIGDSLPSPAIVYKKLTSNPDYDVQFDYSLNPSITTAQACPKNNKYLKTLKFKNDLTQVYTSISISVNVFGTLLEITSDITKISKANTKDKSILNTTQVITPKRGSKNKSTSAFTMEQCNADDSANTTNCITMKLNTVGDSSGKKITVSVVGKTDDTGGYVKTDFDDKITSPNVKYNLEETYDTEGNITYMSATSSPSPTLYYGGLDLSEYGEFYQTSFSFDGEVFVEIDLPTGEIGVDAGGQPYLYTSYDEFVIVPDGYDPNFNPDQVIGYGYFYDDDGDSSVDIGEISIDYFGTAADVPTAWVWRSVYDANFEFIGYEVTYETLSQI